MIKYSDHKLKLAILKLFNIILAVGTFPDIWNKGLITPLYRSGDKYDPNCNILVWDQISQTETGLSSQAGTLLRRQQHIKTQVTDQAVA